MHLSIVIPLLNEAESLPELTAWIQKVCNQQQYEWELIYVDDGSTDESWEVIESLRRADARVKAIKFQRNFGKSAALQVAFKAACGDVVITMDADLQDSPDEIPELYRMVTEEKWDIVSGWKKKRYDNTFTKNIPSKLFNAATRWVSKIQLHDFNCGLKAYRGKVTRAIEVYGEMHRYIPVIAKWNGFTRITEKVVEHRPRKYGTSKFGWERFINGFLDLASITFVGKFGKRPMHFFGLWGTLVFMLGFGISTYLVINKIIDPAYYLTSRPAFYIALILALIGVQLFLAGFLAELIARSAPDKNAYGIEEKIGWEKL
ncbi:MAG: glycosyltransferase [Chitinophagaceae bacterium]|nr:glycosyltransferase [Chitinophagaceae bacterium]